jgi:hypothetical protein
MKNLRPIVTVIISVLVFVFLLWDYFNGGVPSHHILHQKDLPAISNWWNLLLIPTFGAILPTLFILIIASIGFILYKYIRPLFIKLTRIFSILSVFVFGSAFIVNQSGFFLIFKKLYSLEGVWLMKNKNGFIGEEYH